MSTTTQGPHEWTVVCSTETLAANERLDRIESIPGVTMSAIFYEARPRSKVGILVMGNNSVNDRSTII